VTPAIFEPTVMMVAARVSCVLFSVNVVPSPVVVFRESGTLPTVRLEAVAVQAPFAAGFISTATPRSIVEGPSRIRAMAVTVSFLNMSAPT
jgi:hypothetical protein